MSFADELAACRVLPVLTPADVDGGVRTAEALLEGGMCAVEITLRTPAAPDCLRAVKRRFPELTVAAGTVTGAADVAVAVDAGADFCVSPGITAELLATCAEAKVNILPGVATASDVMLGAAHGLSIFKFFPAEAAGGTNLLNALAGPFPRARFCPTGGLTRENFRQYLALPNVICCGGSWMVEDSLVAGARWREVTALARDAMSG